MPRGGHEQVVVVIRIAVEDGERVPAMLHDESLPVVVACYGAGRAAAEEARRITARKQPLDFGRLRFLIAGDIGRAATAPRAVRASRYPV